MVGIRFTYYAKDLPDGRHLVNLFVKDMEPTSDSGEVCAVNDAVDIVHRLVYDNCESEMNPSPEGRLLQPGDPDDSYYPIFMFVIGVTWNKRARCAHYSRVCHERLAWDAIWNPVATLGMEQYEYTMSCLRKHEKKALITNT